MKLWNWFADKLFNLHVALIPHEGAKPSTKRKDSESTYSIKSPGVKTLRRDVRIERAKDISAWNKKVEEKKAKKRR